MGYAQQLLETVRHSRLSGFERAGALVMAVPGGLEARLRSITATRRNRAPAHLASLVPIGAIVFSALLSSLAVHAQNAPATPPSTAAGDAVKQKADKTILPLFQVREATVEEIIKSITAQSSLKVIYQPKTPNSASVTMDLRNIPASEVLHYLASLANLEIAYRADGVYLTDLPAVKMPPPQAVNAPASTEPLVTREWKIPKSFPATLPSTAQALTAQEALTQAGIVFPAGSTAAYSRDGSRLFVKNTQANLDLVEALVELSSKQPAPR